MDEARVAGAHHGPDELSGLPDAELLARDVPDLDLSDPTGHDLAPEAKIELARRAEAAALEADPRITNSEGGDFSDRRARYAYATSHGFAGEYGTSSFSLSASPVARENGEMQRDGWYHVDAQARAARRPGGDRAHGGAARAAPARARGGSRPRRCPSIFDPEMAASLVRHIAGAVSGPSLYRGASFLLGKLGADRSRRRRSRSSTTARCRARSARGRSTARACRCGARCSSTTACSPPICSTPTAAEARHAVDASRARATAAASACRTTNLYLAAGPTDPGELIRSVKSGLYVTELIGFGVNGVTGDYSRGAVGMWIENGELAYPVEEITIAGNLLDMWPRVEGVGNDLVFRDRTAAPTLLIGRMVVAGS